MNPIRTRMLASAFAVSVATASSYAVAEDDVTQLKEQLNDLDQKIRVLQRQQELDKEAAAAKSKETANLSAGKDGFWIRAPDNSYALRIGGVIQLDGRWYQGDAPSSATNAFVLRKVRPVLEGTVSDFIGFRLMPDFGNGNGTTSLQDAYIDVRLNKAFTIRAGKFKGPIGLERLQQDSETEFVERGLPTNLAPNRDTGIQLGGSVLADTVSYQVGVFNGLADNSTGDGDTNDQKDIMARVFTEPFRNGDSFLRGLGIGIAYSRGTQQTAGALAQYKTVGQLTFFQFSAGAVGDGERTKLAPQFYYYVGPFGVLGEYIDSKQEVTRGANRQADFDSRAWQLNAYWVITGEDASFRNPNPRNPYSLKGPGIGAVELVARYGVQTIDDSAFAGAAATRLADPNVSAREATDTGIGVNWYFSRNFKIQLNYDQTRFDGGAAGGKDQPTEKALFSRFQVAF